jgi:phage shock protein A
MRRNGDRMAQGGGVSASASIDPGEIAGLAEAEAVLEAAEDRRDSLQASLDRAQQALQTAEQDRERLVARAASGDRVPAREIQRVAQVITDRGAEVSVLSEALPGAEGEVRRAERAVGTIRGIEKRRQAELARQAYREAEQAVERAAAERDRLWQQWQMLAR